MISLLLCAAAFAASNELPPVDLQRWSLPPDSQGSYWTRDAAPLPLGWASAGVVVGWQREPLVYQRADGTERILIDQATQASLVGAVSLGRVLASVEVPSFLAVGGEGFQAAPTLGDLSVEARAALFGHAAPAGLAVLGRVWAPTTPAATAPWAVGGVRYEIGLAADRAVGPVRFAANVGTRGQPTEDYDGVVVDDALDLRAGVVWQALDALSLGTDLSAQISYADPDLTHGSSPVEALLGLTARVSQGWTVGAAGGAGLNDGIGTPQMRLIASVRYAPVVVWDQDKDGLADAVDGCPDQPEDMDGWLDSDGCPDRQTRLTLQVAGAGGEAIPAEIALNPGALRAQGDLTADLDPGAYLVHVTSPGYQDLDLELAVPEGAPVTRSLALSPVPAPPPVPQGEVELRVADTQRKVIEGAAWRADGADGDAVPNGVVVATLSSGDHQIEVSAPGFVPARFHIDVAPGGHEVVNLTLRPSQVRITHEKLVIADKIYFDTNRASIKAESFGLLDEIAQILLSHPDIATLRVEGHTDARGSNQDNQQLSVLRAAAVRDYLVGQGVAAERLSAVGYGESRPLDDRATTQAYDLNRRVEFIIEHWDT